jgi:hypothetical protein
MGILNFGLKPAISVSGQRLNTLNDEPRLVANSTNGKFSMTAAVSKALQIAVGDYVMFMNDSAEVELAILKGNEQVLQAAQERGYDVNTLEGRKLAVTAFTTWYIAKGFAKFTDKGKPIMANIRYTEKEKLESAISKIDDMLSNTEIYQALAEVMQKEDFTSEELVEVLNSTEDNEFVNDVKARVIDFVQVPQYHLHEGAKTATTGNATGIGCKLNFSDTSNWTLMKSDLENKEAKNRNYKVLLDSMQTIEVNNGYEDVAIDIYPIEFVEDTDPIARGKE